jgi:peptidyl-prolyl cis-trans isomerase D
MLLRSMRKGFFSAIFLGILVLGGVGLVLTDWNGMFRGGNVSTDVAKIEGNPIKLTEFDRLVRRVLQSQNIPADKAYQLGLIDNILQSELLKRALILAANESGIAVEDQHVAKRIQAMIAPLTEEGITAKEALSRFLQMQGMSEQELVVALRSDMETTILRQTVGGNVYTPKLLATTVAAYKGETRTVEFIELKDESVISVKTPNEEDLSAYYNEVKDQYMIPEARELTVAVLPLADIQKSVEVTDEEIKSYYEENKESFRVAETRTVEQAILSDESQAKKVLSAIQKGQSLKKATEKVTGKTSAYTGETSFQKEGLMKEIADPVFAAKEGDALSPIETPVGWQVLVLKKITPEEIPPFEKTSAKIKEELLQNKSGDIVYGKVSEIEDRVAGGEQLEDIAKEYGLALTKVGAADQTAKTISGMTELKPADVKKLLASAFSTPEGETSPMSDISGNRMASVRVDKITAAQSKDMKDVKDDLTKRWTEDRKKQANMESAMKLVDLLDSKKTALEKIAAENKTAVVKKSFSRSEGAPKDMDQGAAARFLAADKDSFLMTPVTGGVVIGRVTDIKIPNKTDDKAIKEEAESLAEEQQQENMMSFASYLQNRYSVVTNPSLLQRYYGSTEQDN